MTRRDDADHRGADDGAASDPLDADAAPPAHRYPVLALVLLAVAAAAMWGASRLTWVTVSSVDGLTEPRTDELDGATWFGALTPLALVLLAAIAAVLATRGWLRRLVGVLIGLVAAVTAVPAFALVSGAGATEDRAATLAELPGRSTVTQVDVAVLPAWLTLAAAVAAFAAALLLARMPERSARLSGKYDSPAVRRAAATEQVRRERDGGDAGSPQGEPSERVLWDALDAGADPTEDAERDPRHTDRSDISRQEGNAS